LKALKKVQFSVVREERERPCSIV